MSDLIIKSGKGSTDVNLTEEAYGDEDIHYLLDFDLVRLFLLLAFFTLEIGSVCCLDRIGYFQRF